MCTKVIVTIMSHVYIFFFLLLLLFSLTYKWHPNHGITHYTLHQLCLNCLQMRSLLATNTTNTKM